MCENNFEYSYDDSIEKDCVTRVINHSEEYIRYNLNNHPLQYRFSPFMKMNKHIWRTVVFYIYKPIADFVNAISTSNIRNHIGTMFCLCCPPNTFNDNMEKYCPDIERRELSGLTLTPCEDIYKCYEYKLGFVNEHSVPITTNQKKFASFKGHYVVK